MTDLIATIQAKSDQLNADDLIGGPITIKVYAVKLTAGESPVSICYDGDNGKPFKPCKTMRRVLVNVWGSDGNKYTGRSMTLYRDPTVRYGGQDVGGIRISHMSHMDKPMVMSLTASKGIKKPVTIQPLVVKAVEVDLEQLKSLAETAAFDGISALADWFKGLTVQEKTAIKPFMEEYKALATADITESENDA